MQKSYRGADVDEDPQKRMWLQRWRVRTQRENVCGGLNGVVIGVVHEKDANAWFRNQYGGVQLDRCASDPSSFLERT